MHIFYNLQFVSLCSCARQRLKLFAFAVLFFHFLIMRKAIPAWPLYVLEWSNRWPLCNQFSVNYTLVLVSVHILVVIARYMLLFLFSSYANNVSVILSEFQ